jgi:hypothetical protein
MLLLLAQVPCRVRKFRARPPPVGHLPPILERIAQVVWHLAHNILDGVDSFPWTLEAHKLPNNNNSIYLKITRLEHILT